jgi:hypothetical protein
MLQLQVCNHCLDQQHLQASFICARLLKSLGCFGNNRDGAGLAILVSQFKQLRATATVLNFTPSRNSSQVKRAVRPASHTDMPVHTHQLLDCSPSWLRKSTNLTAVPPLHCLCVYCRSAVHGCSP